MPGTQLAFSRFIHWVRRGSSCRRGSQLQSLRITKVSFSRYRHQRSLDKKWGISIFSATPSDTDGVGPRKPWRNSALMMAMGRGSISLAQLKTQEQFVRHTSRRAGDSSLPAQSFPFHTLSYILIRSSPYYWISLVLRQQSVCLKCWRSGFDPWVQKIPWRRKWQPTPVPLLGESHGWRSLVGYSPWGHKESDTTERLHFHFLSLSHYY